MFSKGALERKLKTGNIVYSALILFGLHVGGVICHMGVTDVILKPIRNTIH